MTVFFCAGFCASAAAVTLPVQKPAQEVVQEVVQEPAAAENAPAPETVHAAAGAMGEMKIHTAGEEDTLLDIARHFGLGYVEIRAANPEADPWAPLPGSEIVIPGFHLLPDAPREGVVVNLSEMRMYYFAEGAAAPVTFPLGIGKDGLQTPTGQTEIVRKAAYPVWHPTDRMRAEKPWLPVSVPAGPQNPLGTHALYLGWPTFLIHGSNKPWAIGRRVSSGCMRLYPEDIRKVFGMVPVGTRVTVVDQDILAGWVDGALYLEAHPTQAQSNQIEIEGEFLPVLPPDGLRERLAALAGDAAESIDWVLAEQVLHERRGYPVRIAPAAPLPEQMPSAARPARYNN